DVRCPMQQSTPMHLAAAAAADHFIPLVCYIKNFFVHKTCTYVPLILLRRTLHRQEGYGRQNTRVAWTQSIVRASCSEARFSPHCATPAGKLSLIQERRYSRL